MSGTPLPVKPTTVPHCALVLGWAGVTPFVVLSVTTLWLENDIRASAQNMLVAYGAIILGFMGGVQWGLAMLMFNTPIGACSPRLCLIASVVPAIFAFAAVLAASADYHLAAGVVLIVGFVGLLMYDIATVRRGGAPSWYSTLRVGLTVAVVASLSIAGWS
ncbi:MAG: DUF3429 domain-containing protein [Hyphomicrobiaceae bacterium]